MENANKYPENIMRRLRQRLDLKPNDTSRDDELNLYSAKEAFEECCEWEGLIGYAHTLLSWMEYCFGINLNEHDFGFIHFCNQEAQWRLENSGRDFTKEDVDKFARVLYKQSEEWVDSETLGRITDDFLENLEETEE